MPLMLIDLRSILLATTASEEAKPDLMRPDPGVILWTLIIFAVLLVVLKKLAWRPILKMVRERESRVRESIDQANAAKTEGTRLLAEQKELAARNRDESAAFLKNAREEAERVGAELLAKARQVAEEQTERARRQIDEERLQAIASVRSEAIDIALAAAAHLLQKSLDRPSERALVESYIEQLPKNLRSQ